VTIIKGDSRVINRLKTSLTDDARVIIYNRHIFIVQATDFLRAMACINKHVTIDNDDSRVVNKLETSLTDDA